MGNIDLHIHSTVSDGRYTPEEIVRRAAKLGLSAIAIADHDSVDGTAPALLAARAFPGLKVIPNVEISTDNPEGEVHILGYFIDYTSEELQVNLAKFRNSRQTRAQKMVTRLKDSGIHIEWQRVQEIAGTGSIGRPHIALAMLENGYTASLREAFDKYIGYGKPAYVEREKLIPVEAVKLILRAGGLPAMAHPLTVNDPEAMIIRLKAAGLAAIEAYYNAYTTIEIKSLVNLADKHKLIATGGSDYHGLDENTETPLGRVAMPEEALAQLISLSEQKTLKSAGIADGCLRNL